MAGSLLGSVLPDAPAIARRVSAHAWRCLALCHLVPHLEGAALASALEEALDAFDRGALRSLAEDEFDRRPLCRGLASLLTTIEGESRERVRLYLLAVLGAIDPGWIPGLLESLAGVLGPQELEGLADRALSAPNSFTALASSCVLPPPRRWTLRAAALAELRLSPQLFPTEIDQLESTVSALLEAPEDTRLAAFSTAVVGLNGSRAVLAVELAQLAPLGASIGHSPTLAAAAKSLLDVQAWWP